MERYPSENRKFDIICRHFIDGEQVNDQEYSSATRSHDRSSFCYSFIYFEMTVNVGIVAFFRKHLNFEEKFQKLFQRKSFA